MGCEYVPAHQSLVLGQDPQPVVHFFGVGLVRPMAEQVGGITERSPLEGGMDFERERNVLRCNCLKRCRHDLLEPVLAEHQGREATAAVFEAQRDCRQETEVIRNAKGAERGQGMTVVQVKVERFAQRSDAPDQIQDDRQGGRDRGVHVRHELRQAGGLGLEGTNILARMDLRKRSACLPNAKMAGIDAGADVLEFADRAEEFCERGRFQAGGILDKQLWRGGDGFELGIHRARRLDKRFWASGQVGVIVQDHAAYSARELEGEPGHLAARVLLREVEIAWEMQNDGPLFGRTKLQILFMLFRSFGVHFCIQPGLLKAQAGQFQERIVALNPLLKKAEKQGKGGAAGRLSRGLAR